MHNSNKIQDIISEVVINVSHRILHDRFLVIDDIGYIIGPSLKDATRNSPALVVKLGAADSRQLLRFFDGMWGQAKTL